MVSTILLCSVLAPGQAPVPQAPATPYILVQEVPMQLPPSGSIDAPTSPLPATPGSDAPSVSSETPGVGEPQEEREEEPDHAYLVERLMGTGAAGQRLLDNGWKIFGWTNFGYNASTASGSNLPVAFNDRANEFQMYQNWLDISKGIDTEKKEFQWGLRSAWILPGTDARFTLPRGLWNGQTADGDLYPFDPVYHYFDLFFPNLGGEGSTLRVGRFGTICGYEVVDAAFTPFVSRSYNFQYNPFTHTGAMLTTQVNDEFSFYNGAVTGSDVYIDPAARFTYVGGVKYIPKDGKGAFGFNTVITDPSFDQEEGVAHYNVYNFVISRALSDDLEYVLDATFSHMDNVPDVPGTAYWYGFANYFNYKLTDKITSNWRIELFDDVQGVRTGFEGLYFETTYGLAVAATEALIVRPYIRYDYNGYSRPFEDDHHLFLGGLDVIVRW